MANEYNLDTNKFLRNRLSYHAASRVGIQVGQSLAQATNIDGHIVQSKDVWTAGADEFVKQSTDALKTSSDVIKTNEDLVSQFTDITDGTVTKIEIGTDGVNGVIWRNTKFPAIELYENVRMVADEFSSSGTGGKYETYYVYDQNNKRQQVFVPPTAVQDAGNPVPGYSARIQYRDGAAGTWTDLKDVSAWDPSYGRWEFVYLSGMAIFHPEHTPVGKYGADVELRVTTFRYIGSVVSTIVEDIKADADKAIQDFQEDADKAIQDFQEDADEVLAGLVNVLTFKGSKASVGELPKVKSYELDEEKVVVKIDGVEVAADYVDSVVYPSSGDVWHVIADDGEYVYVEDTTELFTGEGAEKVVTGYTVIGRWEEFGTATDYSNFVTTDDADLAENKILVGSGTKKIVDSVYSAAAAVVAVDDSATADAAVLTNEKQVNATALAILAAIEAELCWKENMGE